MQLGSRLAAVRRAASSPSTSPARPTASAGSTRAWCAAFGRDGADADHGATSSGSPTTARTCRPSWRRFSPRFLLEAIPEILDDQEGALRDVPRGVPRHRDPLGHLGLPAARELGVGIAHPAFPHEINKIWEIVEPTSRRPFTQLLWALGLIPMPVSDHWSFVLDVLFCGLTLAALRYHDAQQHAVLEDRQVRAQARRPEPVPRPRRHRRRGRELPHLVVPAPPRRAATASCSRPTPELDERKESGQDWYPPNHFRPLVDWTLGRRRSERVRSLDPRAALPDDEPDAPREARAPGAHERDRRAVRPVPQRHPGADPRAAAPDAAREHGRGVPPRCTRRRRRAPGTRRRSTRMDTPEWQQLYVNAEHDGTVGVITHRPRELQLRRRRRAEPRDRLAARREGIERVIVTGDFHLSTQMVGADTSEFFPALERRRGGRRASPSGWSRTARRLHDEFAISVGFVNGKRCLGGMLELLMHCHYLVAVDDAALGMPEVTLPVVPGMEGCHWPFRKAAARALAEAAARCCSRGGRSGRGTRSAGWSIARRRWRRRSRSSGASPPASTARCLGVLSPTVALDGVTASMPALSAGGRRR